MPTTQETADLLCQLAVHIEHLDESLWDFRLWGRPSDCGTVGCAMGHACGVIQGVEFDGFRRRPYGKTFTFRVGQDRFERGQNAAAEAFNIPISHAELLFLPTDELDCWHVMHAWEGWFRWVSGRSDAADIARNLRGYVKHVLKCEAWS